MQVNPGIFKEYDIRGIYPTDLNEAAARLIGRAFVTFLKAETVIVGHDMRLSGPQIFGHMLEVDADPCPGAGASAHGVDQHVGRLQVCRGCLTW